MRSTLALVSLAALACLAVPPASATLAHTICVPDSGPTQACVHQSLYLNPPDPQHGRVCANANDPAGSAIACVSTSPDSRGNDICVTYMVFASPVGGSASTPACLPY